MTLRRRFIVKWFGGALALLIFAFGVMFALGMGVFSGKVSVRLACHNPMLYNCEQILEEIEESDVFYLSKGEPEFWIVSSRGRGLNPEISTQLYTNKNFSPDELVDLPNYNQAPSVHPASELRVLGIHFVESGFKEVGKSNWSRLASTQVENGLGFGHQGKIASGKSVDFDKSLFSVRTACINPSNDECSVFSRIVREHPSFVIPNHATSEASAYRGCANNPHHLACTQIGAVVCTRAEVEAGKNCEIKQRIPPDRAEGMEWSPVAYISDDVLEEYKAADFQDDFWFVFRRDLDGILYFSLHAFSEQGYDGHPGNLGKPIFEWKMFSKQLETLNEETVKIALEEILKMIDSRL